MCPRLRSKRFFTSELRLHLILMLMKSEQLFDKKTNETRCLIKAR